MRAWLCMFLLMLIYIIHMMVMKIYLWIDSSKARILLLYSMNRLVDHACMQCRVEPKILGSAGDWKSLSKWLNLWENLPNHPNANEQVSSEIFISEWWRDLQEVWFHGYLIIYLESTSTFWHSNNYFSHYSRNLTEVYVLWSVMFVTQYTCE